MHFFNPVPVLKLVEIVRGRETSDETAAAIVALAEELGKTPAVANDFPGFVSNRILMPFINEAVWALHDGVAEAEAIDTIAKLGFAHPLGPLALADLIGLDTCVAIMEVLAGGARRREVRAVPAAARARRGGPSRPQVRPRFLRLRLMDFELSPEQKEIQALTRDFVRAEIEPHAAEWDREHHFPRDVFGKLAELGLMGVCIPEEYGGAGADFLSYMLVIEELSRGDAGVGVTVAVHTSAVTLPLLRFGTEEQRARFVPPLARGELIGAFALTEAEAGSDAGSLRTSATREDGGWHISGAKQFISTAEYAGTFLFFARTDPDTPGARGVSAFVLDADHDPRHRQRGEARAQLLDHELDRGGHARRRRPAAARGGEGLPRRDGDARRRPDRDRRAGGRDRAGGVRRRARVREGAARVRAADRRSSRRSSTSSPTCRRRSTPRGSSSTAPRG